MNKTKTAMITVCGRPNVGKSSLTNALVGEKIAIVSNKPQTTRNRIYGVVNRGDTQYVLLDTPGFHKARNRLGDYMVKVTRESIADVDAVLLLVEPVPHVGIPESELIEKIKASHLPAILCINKIDTVEKKDDLLAVIAAYSEAYAFDAIIPISARTGEGLDTLSDAVAALYPAGETPAGELLTNARQADAVSRALSAVAEARSALRIGMTPDVVLTDCEAALEALGELNGKRIREDLVDTIFSRFCVGK